MTPSELGRIPRYQFGRTGIGCGVTVNGIPHGPACLCDVNVTTPAPILRGIRLPFADLALDVLDESNVSAGNFREWASIMLGCYDEFRKLPNMFYKMNGRDDDPFRIVLEYPENPGVEHDLVPQARTRGPRSPWGELPKAVRLQLIEHAKQGSGWATASVVLPAFVDPTCVSSIRKTFREYKSRYKSSGHVGPQKESRK